MSFGMQETDFLSTSYAQLLPSFNSHFLNGVSPNTTERVPVPSSEHVAEIVGRQGNKIKTLRSTTRTYIKTPMRGEESVFVVTGKKEDVEKAKMMILSAAEHFSKVRASRKCLSGMNGSAEGRISVKHHVPYRYIGLVVGQKGATIKKIQQMTNTYIQTPSRTAPPEFEIEGTEANVRLAIQEIERHIKERTLAGLSNAFAERKIQEALESMKMENNSREATLPTPIQFDDVFDLNSISGALKGVSCSSPKWSTDSGLHSLCTDSTWPTSSSSMGSGSGSSSPAVDENFRY